ncbi:hypothetical protein MKW92_018267, partial [Papaver armeniacum]
MMVMVMMMSGKGIEVIMVVMRRKRMKGMMFFGNDDEEDDGKQDVEAEEQNAKPKPVKRVKKDGTDIAPSARHIPAPHLMLEPLRSGKPRGEPRDGGKVIFGYSGSWAHTIYETI